MRIAISTFLLFVLGTALRGATADESTPLISRQILFGNPDRTSLKISPDGIRVSYLAPLDGVMNVWVANANNPGEAVSVTKDTLRGIRTYFWAHTNDHILYLQDLGGDENWQVHAVDVKSKVDRNLTPFEEIIGPDGETMTLPSGDKMRPTAQIQEVSHKFADEILIGLNKRNPRFHDLYRLNILTGDMELIQQNDRFLGFQTDDDYNIRYALQMTPEGGNEIFTPDGSDGWVSFDKIPMEDVLTTWPVAFDKSGQVLYMIDSRGRNTAALTAVDLRTGDKEVVFTDPRADIDGIMIHPTEKTIQAASSNYTRIEWTLLDESIRSDIDYLETLADGDMKVTSRSLDDDAWTISFVVDDGPVRYFLYDRAKRQAVFLFTNREELVGVALSSMHPVVIKSRDGLDLVSYLTLPSWTDPERDGRSQTPLPTVLFVHGGPWGRDSWGYHSRHQWLASRGYAVLSVNYRGSTGLGKQFINASNLEWAGKMHDDLIDAVQWLIDEKIADVERIAIMGEVTEGTPP